MATINPDKAAQVVALIEESRSRRYIAKTLDMSVSTMQRAYARYLDTNSFQRRLVRDALDIPMTMMTDLLFQIR